jgi:hypothetical protein
MPVGVVTAGVLALLVSFTLAEAQQSPPAPATPADENPSAASAPKGEPAPGDATVDSGVDTKKAPDEKNVAATCKGLEEHPCRKNKACTWIIPKEADKTGQMPAAYCRKLGATKAKAKNTAPPAASSP